MLLLSLHDVTPFQLARIERAEALFADWGVRKLTYLLVPDFHGCNRADKSAAFSRWLRAERPFQSRWALHGYYHRVIADGSSGDRTGGRRSVDRSADEGEFRRLDKTTAASRLDRGLEVFHACLGHDPEAFVAPRWKLDRRVLPLLAERSLTWTESERWIYDTAGNTSIVSPVLRWTTRTPARRWLSMAGTPWQARMHAHAAVLRVALHPFDFDDQDMVRVMARIIRRLVNQRQQRFYQEIMPGFMNGGHRRVSPRLELGAPSASGPRSPHASRSRPKG